jgi:hypothetical protein
VIVAAGGLLTEPRGSRRRFAASLATAAVLVVVVVAPFGIQYARLQRDPAFRRGFAPASGAHLEDLLSAGTRNYLFSHLPKLGPASGTPRRGIESRLFPGLIAVGFGVAGIVIVAREARRRGMREGRTRALPLVALAGAACLVLSFGDWFVYQGHRVFLPFVAFRHFVPGFAGIRAVSRLALGAELALALCAAIGVDALLARRRGAVPVVLTLALALAVCAESALALVSVRVPTSRDDGGVDEALRARPGVVVELPISGSSRGARWPYIEAPRQVLALRDHDPRVNGYSGFQPKDFDTETAKLNSFPAPTALVEARRLGVRYVVLRTALVGQVSPVALTPVLALNRVGRYTDATARSMLDHLPPGTAQEIVRLPGAYLIELSK